jgi:phage baseplate assembly protein W
MSASDPNPKAFLGVGWTFPPQLTNSGKVAEVAYEEDIRQAILIILGTNRGERLMRPDFGAGLQSFVFKPINSTTMSLIQRRVQDSLIAWEARIDVKQVQVSRDVSEPGKLMIDISYQVRATNAIQNLVYPFYLNEGRAA